MANVCVEPTWESSHMWRHEIKNEACMGHYIDMNLTGLSLAHTCVSLSSRQEGESGMSPHPCEKDVIPFTFLVFWDEGNMSETFVFEVVHYH